MPGRRNGDGLSRPAALSAAEVVALAWPCPSVLTPAALAAAAAGAEAWWGLAGVLLRWPGDQWAALLVTPSDQVPAGHPLAAGGLEAEVAGCLAVWGSAGPPDETAGRWLVSELAVRLARRCPAVEAETAVAPGAARPLAPSPLWAAAVGFRPLGFPPRRFRYDLAAGRTARPWRPAWLRPPAWRRTAPAALGRSACRDPA
ncbi:MAG: hypothetical protein LBH76_03870 [Propionibacteriaceae bacterium]|jgi:hypothetical protein|nr:hypothetical protein [Propionibacteriaceae bacterium]